MSHLPAIRDGLLFITPGIIHAPVEAPAWYTWLRDAPSFTFAGAEGTFTARHEDRASGRYWYAYRRSEGRLRKTYLGRSAELTLPRLEQAARVLAQAREASPQRFPVVAEASPLIVTKIAIPRPGMVPIERPALIARCLESIERPCTLITAPAGFGKTTLLIMTCAHLHERGWQIAWVSLEETERDPVRLWTYILAALESAQPGLGVAARRLLQTPRPPAIEMLLTELVNELAIIQTPIALVLDDYHRAATPATDSGLAFLIEHAPSMMHLVIATRAEAAFPIPRLRAQGRIADLHAADLRFSPDESGRFMRETMQIALPADQLERLDARTEGWVAGLQLAALSLREHADIPDLLASIASAPHYIAGYLIDEVLEYQAPDVQAFLLQTAPLERLTGSLCDAVTGRTESASMLAWLMRAQLFVTPLDSAQTWYRYHHLFAEVLCQRLQRTAPDVLARSHQRAALWLQQQGMTGEAIRHLIAAPALDDAATLIEGESDRLILRGEIAGLVVWVRALPREAILAHPHLCVLFAAALILQGESAEATAWLDGLEQRLAQTGARSAEIDGEIAVIRALLLLITGDLAGGAALAHEAMKHLRPHNPLLRGLALWLANITGLLGEEDLSESAEAIVEIAEDSLRAGNVLVAFMALATKAGVEIFQGRLHRAAQTCREALRLVPPAHGQELPITTMAYCLLGEIQREWNELDGAERDLRHGLAVAAHLSSGEFVNDGLVSLAMVQAARGLHEEALATFAEIRHMIRTRQLASWDENQMEMMRVRVLIAQGELTDAARWAELCLRTRQKQEPYPLPPLLREMEDLALARVALAQGHAGEVIAPLEALCVPATRAGRSRNVLEARMLLARARWMSGETDAALRDLEAALALAAPEGFIRVFLDEGEPVADLLASYVTSRPSARQRPHALKLLTAFGRAIEPTTLPHSETLSPRELDVLRLLATGRSNEAIASELVVALSTVKWHVAHIYRKLGVTGRMRAVARARELRLIA